MNAISQECFEGPSSSLEQSSTWSHGPTGLILMVIGQRSRLVRTDGIPLCAEADDHKVQVLVLFKLQFLVYQVENLNISVNYDS